MTVRKFGRRWMLLGGGASILIIDDDPVIHVLFRSVLEPAGYDLVFASTGRQGIQAARGVRPTLILLDYSLPDLQGSEVFAQLRADEASRRLPVVFVTAKSGSDWVPPPGEGILGLIRGGGVPRADRPDRLVRDDET